MKTLIRIGVVCLFAALPSQAFAWGYWPPVEIDAGVNAWFYIRRPGYNQNNLAPWYLYWPHEAQFQTPAPLGGNFYPHWPRQWPPQTRAANQASPQEQPNSAAEQNKNNKLPLNTPPQNQPGSTAPSQLPFTAPPPGLPSSRALYPYGFQPTRYSHQAPSYWYSDR